MNILTSLRGALWGGLLAGLLAGCGASAGEQDPPDTLSQAPLPPAEQRRLRGYIVFRSNRAGQPDLYAVRAAGTAPRRLTWSAAPEVPAEALPGDSLLLAISTTDDSLGYREQLVLLPLRPDRAAAAQPLGPPSRRARAPDLAPGGRWLVYEASRGSFRDLYRLRLRSSASRRLTDDENGNFGPQISPDGRYVAFESSRDGNSELYRMKADGTKQERLTHFHRDDWRPRWSPDGQTIAFLSDREGKDRIFLMNANGDRQRRLNADRDTTTTDTARYAWQEAEHVWSPTGTKIAYVRKRPQGPAQLWVVDVASGKRRQLSPADGSAGAPTWSPGGKYLAFAEGARGAADLYLVRADGTGRTRLTTAPGDDWEPRWMAGTLPAPPADSSSSPAAR